MSCKAWYLRNSVEEIYAGKVGSGRAETSGDKLFEHLKNWSMVLNKKLIRSGRKIAVLGVGHGPAAWPQLFLFSKLNGRIRLHKTAFLA
jgi:hypothetical protein